MIKKLLITAVALPVLSLAQFTQNFESSSTIPTGWTTINGGDTNTWQIVDFTGATNIGANSGTKTASIAYGSAAHNDYLITPAINVTADVNDFFSFYARSRDPEYPEVISLKISTSTPTAANFTTVLASEIAPESGANFYKYSFDLSNYVGQTIYIAFHSQTTDMFFFDIDDVVSGPKPSCDAPSGVLITGVTDTSAVINWTASFNTSATYEIQYGPTGFTLGNGTTVQSNTNSMTLSNLSAQTKYDVYVRANCSTDGYSDWTPIKSFTTQCPAITSFPLNEAFSEAIPACWKNEAVSGGGSAVWTYVTANGNATITPQSAPRMAEFRTTSMGSKAKLVTPNLDLSNIAEPKLKFYYANTNWFGDVDELRVYYKANPSDAWTQIGASYVTEKTVWTEVTLDLPNKSSNYQIAFEGTSNWARGINLDDVSVYDATLATSDASGKAQTKIYPNPVKDMLTISTTEKVSSIKVYTFAGQLVAEFNKDSKEINLSKLEKGAYLVRIKSDKKDESFKVIKD